MVIVSRLAPTALSNKPVSNPDHAHKLRYSITLVRFAFIWHPVAGAAAMKMPVLFSGAACGPECHPAGHAPPASPFSSEMASAALMENCYENAGPV